MLVKHSQLAQELILPNAKNIVMKSRSIIIFHPMNNQTYSTKNAVKQNISVYGRSALYQEEQSQGCSSEELTEATESYCESWW